MFVDLYFDTNWEHFEAAKRSLLIPPPPGGTFRFQAGERAIVIRLTDSGGVVHRMEELPVRIPWDPSAVPVYRVHIVDPFSVVTLADEGTYREQLSDHRGLLAGMVEAVVRNEVRRDRDIQVFDVTLIMDEYVGTRELQALANWYMDLRRGAKTPAHAGGRALPRTKLARDLRRGDPVELTIGRLVIITPVVQVVAYGGYMHVTLADLPLPLRIPGGEDVRLRDIGDVPGNPAALLDRRRTQDIDVRNLRPGETVAFGPLDLTVLGEPKQYSGETFELQFAGLPFPAISDGRVEVQVIRVRCAH